MSTLELFSFKKAFGKQDYEILDDSYKTKISEHPLLNSIYAVGKSFFLVVNTHSWQFEHVTGDTEGLSGFSIEEIMEREGDFLLNYPIEEHRSLNYATVGAAMEYISKIPVEQREMVFVIYYYTATKKNGEQLSIQHQSIPLVFDENHIPFIFCNIITDISYLDPQNIPQGIIINKYTSEKFSLNKESFLPEKKEEIFSPREKEVIKLLSSGLTSKEIADQLSISTNTVRTHRKKILGKAGISNTTTLIKYALVNGVL